MPNRAINTGGRMFVANLTSQSHDFLYQLPLNPQPIRVVIPPFSQRPLQGSSGEQTLTTIEIEGIIRHHGRYGMIPHTEIHKIRPDPGRPGYDQVATLAYSLDKPMPEELLRGAREGNMHVLDAVGRQIRKESAVAVNNQIEQDIERHQAPLGLTSLEMAVIEEDSVASNAMEEHDQVNEMVRVAAAPGDAPKRPTRQARNTGRRRAA